MRPETAGIGLRLLRLGFATLAVLALVAAPASARRAFPDTSGAIHVFEDQMPDSMTSAQIAFVAAHIDGTQKIARATAERLRAINPRFLVLHYRLAIGDGPVPFRIGGRWASDYGFVRRHVAWFWHSGRRRVLQTTWRWFLMNPDSGWRAYWARRVLYEARLLDDDGVFADSLSVPQYLGADSFAPPLRYFVGESAWTGRVDRFMRYEERRLRGRLWFVPNAGSWITTRDRTDYSIPDGVMIEGFAEPGAGGAYATGDWRLQMDRILHLVSHDRIILAQSYLDARDLAARSFVLASYLLTKGRHSFLNMDAGQEPEWFPEYGLSLGPAVGATPQRIDSLATAGGLYARSYRNGVAVANPDDAAHLFSFDGTRWLAEPYGGGHLGPDAATGGSGIRLRAVTGSLTVAAHGGAVLLDHGP